MARLDVKRLSILEKKSRTYLKLFIPFVIYFDFCKISHKIHFTSFMFPALFLIIFLKLNLIFHWGSHPFWQVVSKTLSSFKVRLTTVRLSRPPSLSPWNHSYASPSSPSCNYPHTITRSLLNRSTVYIHYQQHFLLLLLLRSPFAYTLLSSYLFKSDLIVI